MAVIDYKKYLDGLGMVQTKQVDRVKEYLEKQCESDEALKAAYNPEKIADCYAFIEGAVRQMPCKGSTYCIEDAVVYKMARDYYLEILPNLIEEEKAKKKSKAPAEEKPVDISEAKAAEEVSKQMDEDAASDKEKHDYCGFEVFGEEADEPAEAAEEEPCNQDEVGEKEPVIYEGEGEDEIVQTIVEDDCITVTGRQKPDEEKVLQPVASDTPKYDEEGNGLLFDI
jgi:hypothetical protein